jgi:hypothetical protein
MPPPSPTITNFPEDTQRSEHQMEVDLANATARISAYKSARRDNHENLTKDALNAFISWLPEEGSANMVNEIIDASSERDQGIYEVFVNLYTDLRARNKSLPPSGLISFHYPLCLLSVYSV